MSVISWLGNAEYGVAGTRLQEGNPVVFRPPDISGLQVWLDANNGSAVYANGFGTVESWFNQGDLSGNFDLSGTADVRYGDNRVNGLNVVTFNANAFMTGTFAMNFQPRSLFIVSRRNTPIDTSGGIGLFTWLTGDVSGAIETGILYDVSANNFQYIVSKHPGFSVELDFLTSTDTTGYSELATFVNSSTDLSANYVALNGVAQTPIYQALASGYYTGAASYFIGNYFGGQTLANDYDLCEVVMYDSALDATQIALVEEYLISKWAVTSPPAPIPPIAPFTPQDISGLYLWLDATQSISTTGANEIVSWSNVGLAGSSLDSNTSTCYLSTTYNGSNIVHIPSESYIEGYMQFPYNTRTTFAVFESVTDLSGIAYPYINLLNTGTEGGRQIGFDFSIPPSTAMALCQQGLNCPASGYVSSNPVLSGMNLGIWALTSNTPINNFCSFNTLSNVNTSTDVGNLFNTNPIYYNIGSPVVGSPSFNVAEIIEYDSYLTNGQISTVANYLVNKWAISSFTG